ncbi:MAG: hypothetical protein H7146_09290 [Burkholderiaceae bacterium]|nr:hypothetical protein [Microbacteriaceae bacterium]
MTTSQLTRHQLDPAGTRGVQRMTIVLLVIGVAWALVKSAFQVIDGANLPLAALGFAVFVIPCLVVGRSAGVTGTTLTSRTHAAVQVLLLASFAVSTWAGWSTDAFTRDHWAPMAFGIVILAMSPYRPPREIAAYGTVLAIAVGGMIYVHATLTDAALPARASAVVSSAGILAVCYGAATFSRRTIEALQRWQARADVASDALADELRDNIAQSVHQDRLTILERDVVPFFTDLLERTRVTDDDRERARAIAGAIRGIMVADADRSWLTAIVERDSRSARSANIVDDSQLLAAGMDINERTALRALIGAIDDDPTVSGGFSITLARDDDGCVGVLSARLDTSEHSLRVRYDPFFAVMKIAFIRFSFDFHHSDLIVRFSYVRP